METKKLDKKKYEREEDWRSKEGKIKIK